MTTSNHGSYPGGTPPFPNLSEVHQLALSRVEAGQCPCCGKAECAAAFQPGDEPLSMQEAYGLVPGRPNYKPTRLEQYRFLRELKKKTCSCDGKVFPSPPCDVFREPNTERKKKIEAQWDAYRDEYRRMYAKTHGVALKRYSDFSAALMGAYSPTQREAMLATAKLGRAARAANPLAQEFDTIQTNARKLERINHLTPKEAGGCPTNHDNLQPQQKLCEICQDIDQYVTDHWQG